MGAVVKLIGLVVVATAIIGGFVLNRLLKLPELPEIEVGYWGPGSPKSDDKTIKPFKIQIPQSEIKRLREKLELAEPLTASLEDAFFQYGMNSNYFKGVLDYWKTKYNWSEREVFLNQFPHFKTQIGGLDLHFMHVKPDPAKAKGKEVIPLLLVHGWPGSIREFYDIIPLLTTTRAGSNFVFEVIAPSLPGYGFSQPAAKKGFCPPYMAAMLNELMARLGFEKYYYQGGDWGSLVGHAMSVMFPDSVLGYHSNFCLAQTSEARLRLLLTFIFPSLLVDERYSAEFRSQLLDVYVQETGYFHIQATKPDTIGIALTDSPVGLAGYLFAKFGLGTNRRLINTTDGGLDQWNTQDILDNVMIYWLTKSITPASRLYKEVFHNSPQCQNPIRRPVLKVPVGCAIFPNEIAYHPLFALKSQFEHLLSATHLPRGGHFAAFEVPDLLADDLWNFVSLARDKP